MSIEQYIEQRSECIKSTVDGIKRTQSRLKELLENPVVVEFITEEENLKDLEKKKKKQEKEFQEKFQNECDHPVFALIDVKHDYGIESDIYCIVCGKKVELSPEKKGVVLNELFSQKRLLANYSGISERTGLLQLRSLTGSVEKASKAVETYRKNYYKFYQAKRKSNSKSLDNDKIDDEFFMSLCFDGYQFYLYDEEQKTIKK